MYNTKSLMPGYHRLSDSLSNYYKYPALPPVMDWKEADPLPKPEITELIRHSDGSKARIKWVIPTVHEEYVRSFVIYRFLRGERRSLDDPKNILAIVRNKEQKVFVDYTIHPEGQYEYAVTALDRLSNEGKPSKLHKLR